MAPMAFAISALLVLATALIVFRVFVRRDYRRQGRLTALSTLLEYVAIGSWVCLTWLARPPDWPAAHVGSIIQALGWALFVGGWLVVLAGLGGLGIGQSHGRKVSELKQSGPYRVTRNPQAVAFLVAIGGWVMVWPTWYHLVALVLLAAILHTMILTEEEHLRDVFGPEYVRYCERVPRYLGIPRRAGSPGQG